MQTISARVAIEEGLQQYWEEQEDERQAWQEEQRWNDVIEAEIEALRWEQTQEEENWLEHQGAYDNWGEDLRDDDWDELDEYEMYSQGGDSDDLRHF